MKFTEKDIGNLKEKISEAEENGDQIFEYKSQEFDVDFARYLIQYLKARFNQT